ncbi:VWA-like domain-containing protein [Clostridium sp.]|uniref:vWA domain-containing protein n=1 Tax=Clostridium sp. TaxID=1506 RepID=UPI00321758E8
MGKGFEELRIELYSRISDLESHKGDIKGNTTKVNTNEDIWEGVQEDFFKLIDRVNFILMDDNENFYGYFLIQMEREVRYDITTPTAVNFKGAKYVIYFNPIIFLQLNLDQMQGCIKHEIHHILSLHLIRARKLKEKYSTLAINMAMDIVVNEYIEWLPSYATTLDWVNLKYDLNLEPYNSMEYYVDNIQQELNLLDDDEGEEDHNKNDIEDEYDPKKTHDIWEESKSIDDKTIQQFTEKFATLSDKGKIPIHIESLIKALGANENEIPWNLYLKRIMGTLESSKKKTITRRSRRQPNRLDLRGELRGHRAKITVAIDISGSISDAEFKQAIEEVLAIVKNYNYEITIIECDTEIKRVYKTKSIKGVRDRIATGGGTRFTPVFEYVNKTDTNLLVYFTDGKGEDKVEVTPRGYKTLWVISGKGDELSLKHPFGEIKKLSKVESKEDFIDMQDVRSDGWSMNSHEPTI